MIPHTIISMELGNIPRSAGLNRRINHRPPSKATVGHQYQQRPKFVITVAPDPDLEEEIAKFKGDDNE